MDNRKKLAYIESIDKKRSRAVSDTQVTNPTTFTATVKKGVEASAIPDSFVTPSEASKMVKESRATIHRAIDKKRISVKKDVHGHFHIDPQELFRVFKPLPNPEQSSDQSVSSPVASQTAVDPKPVGQTEEYLLGRIKELEEEKDDYVSEIAEQNERLADLRNAMKALPSPESVAEKNELLKELEISVEEKEKARLAAESEKHKVLALEKEKLEKFKEDQRKEEIEREAKYLKNIEERKAELDAARNEAEEIKNKAQQELAAEKARNLKLKNRGLWAVFRKKDVDAVEV